MSEKRKKISYLLDIRAITAGNFGQMSYNDRIYITFRSPQELCIHWSCQIKKVLNGVCFNLIQANMLKRLIQEKKLSRYRITCFLESPGYPVLLNH